MAVRRVHLFYLCTVLYSCMNLVTSEVRSLQSCEDSSPPCVYQPIVPQRVFAGSQAGVEIVFQLLPSQLRNITLQQIRIMQLDHKLSQGVEFVRFPERDRWNLSISYLHKCFLKIQVINTEVQIQDEFLVHFVLEMDSEIMASSPTFLFVVHLVNSSDVTVMSVPMSKGTKEAMSNASTAQNPPTNNEELLSILSDHQHILTSLNQSLKHIIDKLEIPHNQAGINHTWSWSFTAQHFMTFAFIILTAIITFWVNWHTMHSSGQIVLKTLHTLDEVATTCAQLFNQDMLREPHQPQVQNFLIEDSIENQGVNAENPPTQDQSPRDEAYVMFDEETGTLLYEH